MKRKTFFIVALLMMAAIVPLMVINVQAVLSAGPDQEVYTDKTVIFNGTTTENVTAIIQVTWDFGDNTTAVNGSSPDLLNTNHVYAMAGVYKANLTVIFGPPLNMTETAIATITVTENQPPIADAGPNQIVEQDCLQGASVTLDGTESSDPGDDPLTYYWNWTGDSAMGSTSTAVFPVGNTTVTLTVSDGQYNATDTVNIEVQQDTSAPVVDAGPDVTVEQESQAGTQVVLNGTAADNVSTRFNFTWSENSSVLSKEANVTDTTLTFTFNLGTHIVTLNATDETGNLGSDNVTVTVVDTKPPEVDAGSDVTVEQESHEGTEVTLHGAAEDICSTEFDFAWSEDGAVLGTEQNLTYIFNLGIHIITLNVTDVAGNTGSDNVTVTVVDTTPPEISITVSPDTLWPPNHKYVEVEVAVTVYDTSDPAPTLILLSITSNEPDNAKGDGGTVDDIVTVNDFTFNLRAERSGGGSSRTYTITYQATDSSGNTAQTSITVEVPHNK